MLAQVTRQVLYRLAQLKIFAQARMAQVQSSIAETVIKRVMRIAILPGGDSGRNFVQSLRIETQRLAHFT